MSEAQPHISVMLDGVVSGLALADGEVYVDGTFGAGGYSTAILDQADCTVIGIDRDKTALAYADKLKEKYGERLIPVHGCFGDVENIVRDLSYEGVDGFVLDLGVSSMQLDEAERGFSFRFDAPLDMRMDQSADIPTAADIVNGWPEKELADAIYLYGDERHSRRIAKAIVMDREEEPFTTTGQLAGLIGRIIPKTRKDEINPATRTFQALRIVVNEELGELEKALQGAEKILKAGGRLVVVSFHSLEDRIVKRFMRERSGGMPKGSRHAPVSAQDDVVPTFSLLSKKALLPTDDEMALNPRSRSARMRVAIRTEAPSQQSEAGQERWRGTA